MYNFQSIIKIKKNNSWKPIFFRLSNRSDAKRLKALIKKKEIRFITDEYVSQLEELFQIKYPNLVYSTNYKNELNKFLKQFKDKRSLQQQGVWVYYPWIAHLVHILDEDAFFEVRTARNKNLISMIEQEKLYNAKIGIAGLSIGSSIALLLCLQGISKTIKLADNDNLELTNTNRILTSVANLGLKKVHMTARSIYLINPYANVIVIPKKIDEENILNFLNNVDIVIDEIDDFPTKILLRDFAKKKKIPLITSIDNSDGSVLEIERYDRYKNMKSFTKRFGNISYKQSKKMSKTDVGKLIAQQVGLENITSRMYESFSEIGKSVVSWPQLGGAALLNGVLVSYCARQILLSKELNNRVDISLDELLLSNPESKKQRTRVIKKYSKLFQ